MTFFHECSERTCEDFGAREGSYLVIYIPASATPESKLSLCIWLIPGMEG
jgi:hypothetical protein